MMLDALVEKVREHAASEAPRECCGLAVVVKGRLRYWPCKNISLHNDQFEIDPLDYAAAEDAGEIVGVCHSHVFVSPQPSEADRVMCEFTGLPWLIVNHPVGTHVQIEPSGYMAPLVGRQYTHGVLDCYQIVVDHYKRELGIELPHFAREDGWWDRGENLYLENFEKAGFVMVGDGMHRDIRPHDGLLIQVGCNVPNHAAVYLGDGMILQHVYGRLSSRDVYGGYWQKHTTHVLRHRSMI
jgi:proteasome lid subunit RPN8/RPN11